MACLNVAPAPVAVKVIVTANADNLTPDEIVSLLTFQRELTNPGQTKVRNVESQLVAPLTLYLAKLAGLVIDRKFLNRAARFHQLRYPTAGKPP